MDTATGEIHFLSDDDVAKINTKTDVRARFLKLIPDELLTEMQGMNRAQRREYYRKNKKKFAALKKAKEG